MLNFSEFQDYALMTIPERLPEEYKGAQIRSHEVEKNNGIVLHGITVTPEDSNIAPNVYLDGYFKSHRQRRKAIGKRKKTPYRTCKQNAYPHGWKNPRKFRPHLV